MKDKTRKIIAWIGLICMIGFIIAMMMTLIDSSLFDDRIGYVALALFILAIVPFALIYFENRAKRQLAEEAEAEKARHAENKRKREENARKQALKDNDGDLSSQTSAECGTDNGEKTEDGGDSAAGTNGE